MKLSEKLKQLLCIHKPSDKPSEQVIEETERIIHLRECAKCGKVCKFPIRVAKTI